MFEALEGRTYFSAYAISPIVSLPTTPSAALVIDSSGNLYGVTQQGGSSNDGTVFEVSATTGQVSVLHSFGGDDGANPDALAIDPSGNLIGFCKSTTNGLGNAFELAAGTRAFSVIASFTSDAIGDGPRAIAIDPSGNIYGTTSYGGTNLYGTLFEITATTHTFSTRYNFTSTDDFDVQYLTATSTSLYGDCPGGGVLSNAGEIVEFPNFQGPITVLGVFNEPGGSSPSGSPYVDAGGNVFGTTTDGGPFDDGTLFEVPGGQSLTTVETFNTGQMNPTGNLVADPSGNLWGTTANGSTTLTTSRGTVFEFNPTSRTITYFDLTDSDGLFPANGLVTDGAANFFGYTTQGGSASAGMLFEVTQGTPIGGGGGTTGGGTGTTALVPTVAKSTAPTSIVNGTKLKGTISLTVTNSTSATVTGKDTFAVYASTNGTIDSNSIAVGTASGSPKVVAGGAGKATVHLKPVVLPAGTYTLLAQTTDSAGVTTIATAGPALVVAAPVITLSATLGAVAPAMVKAGKPITLTLTLTNTGNTDSTGSATIAIGLSVDGSTIAVPLPSQKKSSKIKAGGKPTIVKLHVKTSTTLTAGSYVPIVTYTQGVNAVTAVGTTPFSVI